MAHGKTTYSSTFLRERDQQLQAQHENELKDLRRRHAYVERNLNVRLFESTNRGRKLAELLGYSGLDEALMDVESSGLGPSLRDSVQRVQAAKARLELEQVEVKLLQAKLSKMEQLHDQLLDTHKILEKAYRRLKGEHEDLIVKYDKLADIRRRAGERYKIDYQTWKTFYHWLVSDKPDSEHPGVSAEEKKKINKWKPGVMRKRQDIIEGRINVSFLGGYSEDSAALENAPPFGAIEMRCDKENEGMPTPIRKKRRLSVGPHDQTSPSPLAASTNSNPLKSITNVNAHPKPPSRLAGMTSKLLYIPPPPSASSTSTLVASSRIRETAPPSEQQVANSSETEDDSQPVWLPKNKLENIITSRRSASPSATSSSKSEIYPSLRPRSKLAQSPPERATSRLSLSDLMPVDKSESSASRGYITSERQSKLSLDLVSSTSSRKGKERQIQDDHTTPAQDKSVRPDDYSAYKGHGRYGKSAENAQPTINTLYAIDPSNNGGLDYQYDEVVRSREARRKMHAGDCECCREYYEGVGPLPARLQPPLWRSPTSSPQKNHSTSRQTVLSRQKADIEAHKKAISRHRHTWARAPTPPGYWNIGFPNTQEATEINRKAAEMHRRKQDDIDREAAGGGRYRRKS